MYVAVIPNRSSRPAILLRESYRDGDSVKNRTLANLHKSKGFAAIGLAFSGQEVATVPALQHDVPLDYVLTEKKAFDFRSS